MYKYKIISIVFCIMFGVTFLANATETVSAFLVDYQISLNKSDVNKLLENPIVSYNERTYISLRDVAKIFDKDVEWDENNETIEMYNRKKEDVIKDTETALLMGKAIICQFFPNDVNNDTIYEANRLYADHRGADPMFLIQATFQTDNDKFFAYVTINSVTGEIISVKKNFNGENKIYYPYV